VTPVEFTEASSYRLGTRVELPGTVESLRLSQIASQVDGLVEELLVREGEKVEQGQVLARLDTDTLEARRNTLEAQLLEAQARLRSADTRLRRARELFEAEVISEEQFDDARYEWEALKANVESLKASVEEIDVQLRQSVIKAPFRGAVTAKLTEIGQWLGAGDPVVELLALDALEVTVDVPEIHVGKIRLGQGARVRLEALPNRPLNGRVSAVVPRASQDTRTFPVKVAISALNGQVRTGMLASVSLVPSDPRQATIVPKDGLVASGTGWMVFTINGDNTVSPVEVEPGEGIGQCGATCGPATASSPGATNVCSPDRLSSRRGGSMSCHEDR